MMKHMTRIGVVMTAHNRKDKTIECLRRLYTQEGKDTEFRLSVYLTDDGSTDGTSAAVKREFPDVHISMGDGNLFWGGGMRQSFSEAMKKKHDFYLWLNDDTFLDAFACKLLLSDYKVVAKEGQRLHVIGGTTREPHSNEISYGGGVRCSFWHPFHYKRVVPGKKPKPCDGVNGNCVLIPREVVELVGNIDPIFTHVAGDGDYFLRTRKLGGAIWVCSEYTGTCEYDHRDIWYDRNMPLRKRWAMIQSVKGRPAKEYKVFARRHGGFFWPIIWCLPYLKCIFLPTK